MKQQRKKLSVGELYVFNVYLNWIQMYWNDDTVWENKQVITNCAKTSDKFWLFTRHSSTPALKFHKWLRKRLKNWWFQVKIFKSFLSQRSSFMSQLSSWQWTLALWFQLYAQQHEFVAAATIRIPAHNLVVLQKTLLVWTKENYVIKNMYVISILCIDYV